MVILWYNDAGFNKSHLLYDKKWLGKIHFKNGKGYCRLFGGYIANMLRCLFVKSLLKLQNNEK